MKVLSLFSGIGAFEKALTRQNIKYELLNFSEIDKNAIIAYCLIHNVSEDLNLGDVTKINTKELADFDLMTWGFPCTDISAAGKQKGFIDEKGNKTKSGLYYDGLKILQDKKPKYSIIENVKALTQKRFQREFKQVLDDLKIAGYNNYWKVLNAKDYGVPQNRERVFIISIRRDVDKGNFVFPESIPLKKNLQDIIESDAELPILHNVYGGFKEKKPRIFEDYSPTIRTAKGGGHIPSIYIKGCNLRTRSYKGQPQTLEIRKDEFLNAITTVQKDSMIAFMNGLSKNLKEDYLLAIKNKRTGIKIIDGKLIRYLTCLEVFRLMDFDDDDYYILKENNFKDRAIYNLAGNSIVVSVLEEIFNILLK